jgi:hypothetical protein
MLVKGPIEKARLYVGAQQKLEEELEENNQVINPGPCITISREPGARADIISERLIDFFGKFYNNNPIQWTVFDKNLIEKVLQDHQLPLRLSKLLEEKKYSAVQSITAELLGGQPSIWSLVHKTTETILQLAQMGNVIILDRGANVITSKLWNTFHIRLVAPLENRISHVQSLYNFDKKSAMDYIKREDLDRKDYVINYFHKDINDPLLYHLLINTHMISDEEASEIIGKAVIEKFPEMFSLGD